MNILEYYDRKNDSWDSDELRELETEYKTNEMTINEIADIHRRTPGSIAYRLRILGIIPHHISSRGYCEYINSKLYKDIIEQYKKERLEKEALVAKRKEEKLINKGVKSSSPIVCKTDINANLTVDAEKKMTRRIVYSDSVAEIKSDINAINEKLNIILEFIKTLPPTIRTPSLTDNIQPMGFMAVPPTESTYSIMKGSGLLDDECHLLQFDGLSNPNPGESTAGAVLFSPIERKPVFERGAYMGNATNNQAEYTGLLIGLKGAIKFGVKNILIEGDSQLVIFQTEGKWKVTNETLKSIHDEIKALLDQFDYIGIRHIPRENNTYADKITNDVLRTKKSFFIKKSMQ
jgi:ribonuclease HI